MSVVLVVLVAAYVLGAVALGVLLFTAEEQP